MGGIYEIRNRVTGKAYVGRAQNFAARFNRHRYELRHGRHHCLHLQRAWNKHGEAAFEFVIVQECAPEVAISLERRRLKSLEGLYNISASSCGGDLISKHPDRDAIVARMRGSINRHYRQMNPAERQRRYGRPGSANGMFGRRHTPEAKAKMSARQKGKGGPGHPNFGLKRSPEFRRRLSVMAAARTGEANAFFGRQHSEAAKAKMADKARGRTPGNVRAVVADGQPYPSVTGAAKALGISPALVIYRIRSLRYAYRYQEEV